MNNIKGFIISEKYIFQLMYFPVNRRYFVLETSFFSFDKKIYVFSIVFAFHIGHRYVVMFSY